MGDGADYTDIMRFMMSQQGKGHLATVRKGILGKRVASVRFENNTGNIKTILQLEDGFKFYCIQPCHDITVIRELFGDCLLSAESAAHECANR